MSLQHYNRSIIHWSIAGLLLSTYALYVELVAEARPGYKAFCDISEGASCSRVLTSGYSKGFGVTPAGSQLEMPNCIYGTFFYCNMIFLATYDNVPAYRLQFLLAIISLLCSLFLAYLLAFVLYDFCIVCVSTYIVNIAIIYFIYAKGNALKLVAQKTKLS